MEVEHTYGLTDAVAIGGASTGTTYNMYDAMTGKYILSIVNGTGFSKDSTDDHGGLIGYYTNSSQGTNFTYYVELY